VVARGVGEVFDLIAGALADLQPFRPLSYA
jgi:hypothetical protein